MLRLAVRGASHARALAFELTGFPAGERLDRAALAAFMARRAPGRDRYATARRETDEVAFLSGLAGGVTTGETVRGEIANRDARPADYGAERTVPRPGHADFGQWIESGRIPTGGGANSGRLTAPVCAAGALCRQFLERRGISVAAEVLSVAGETRAKKMLAAIDAARKDGDSVGGVVRCTVTGLQPGLGGALFAGLESGLSAALFAIPGAKGVAFGDAAAGTVARGSAFNDAFAVRAGRVVTETNRHGGILGGRASGMPVVFDVLFKPTPTVFKAQRSVDLATMRKAEIAMKGRHDPCIVRRAAPVVEAMAALAFADAILADGAAHPRICLTLTGRTLAEDLAQFRAERYFTDMVELRVDLLDKDERARAADFPKMLAQEATWRVPVVFTFRRARDGGAFAGAERTRERFFRDLLAALPPGRGDYVDFEDDFRVPALVKRARAQDVRVIRSHHAFEPTDAIRRSRLRFADADVAKLAFVPRGLAAVARLIGDATGRTPDDTTGRAPGDAALLPRHVPALVCAMGPQGFASRVLASRVGSPWTYASVGGLASLGHVTPHELVRDYRFRSVTRNAALFGVTGWPLAATRSPELHNAAFAAEDLDAVMVPFPAKTAREALAFMKATGMRGMAVTIPHKQSIMPLLDAVSPEARQIGAVNTVKREGDRFVGYNTDAAGFAAAFTAFLGVSRRDLPIASEKDDVSFSSDAIRRSRLRSRLRVAVLGAGGAAKAVVHALRKLGASVEVFHRRPLTPGFDAIVNATPVDPIPDYRFTGRECVYDLVYVPAETPLMARARAAGCRVSNGFSMLVEQAREQRRIWLS